MDNAPRHIVMVASENDSLAGGKVGGVGDVMRGLPKALAGKGWRVTTIIPAYGSLHKKNLSKLDSTVEFPFAGQRLEAEIWEVEGKQRVERLTHFVVEHHDIRGEPIYINDPPESPFKHDATKFALFCSAVGQFLASFQTPYILHLHDWHAASLLMLRELHAEFFHLNHRKTVFTVHNLAVQGTRPIEGDESSLKSWFPELFENTEWVDGFKDQRYEFPCYTPIAFGIRLSDKLNTVSPSYARDILKPSDDAHGFCGGEGLEEFVRLAKDEGRLFGILNGTDYPEEQSPIPSFAEMCELICNRIANWSGAHVNGLSNEIIRRCQKFKNSFPRLILTSITRVVEQKVRLLLESGNDGRPALERILERIEQHNGVYFFLGTGTPDYENRLSEFCKTHERFIFLNGFSPPIAQAMYRLGTLFLMPSLFEPCGISQMIAMSEGQPCVVHAVGGLKDTVIDGVNGFAFSGSSYNEKAENLAGKIDEALNLYLGDPHRWRLLREKAARTRFTWEASAQQYIDLMYS